MFLYEVIVELMNIYEIKYKISNQAISRTSHDNLVRFAAISSFHQCVLKLYKIKSLRSEYNTLCSHVVETESLTA